VLAEMRWDAVSANADQFSEIGAAIERLAAERVDVVVVMQTNLMIVRRFMIAEAALANRLPTVYGCYERCGDTGCL
jgi:hypothetical protein